MVPEHKTILDAERTEQIPAQEKVASGAQAGPTLTAEQVYTQRMTERPLVENGSSPDFIP
jgi:hypothetical protein